MKLPQGKKEVKISKTGRKKRTGEPSKQKGLAYSLGIGRKKNESRKPSR